MEEISPISRQSVVIDGKDRPASSISEATILQVPEFRPGWAIRQWKLEILSWLGGFACFMGIIGVLAAYQGRPLPDLPEGVSLNAVIGFLATLGSSFQITPVASAVGQAKWLRAHRPRPLDDFRMMDEASRGPWGSFLLLLYGKGGLLSSLGALITVLALTTSFFVQQVVNYETRYPLSGSASMPFAQTMRGDGVVSLNPGSASADVGVDPELLAAPWVGLFSPPKTDFPTAVQCSSGNCTWPSYQTLAICNTCVNLTSQLQKTIVKAHSMRPSNGTNASKDSCDGTQGSNCTEIPYDAYYYLLPNGFGLTGPTVYTVNTSTYDATLNMTAISGSAIQQESIAFANNGSVLLSVLAVGSSMATRPLASNLTAHNQTTQHFAAPVAFECAFQLCVRTMNATYQNTSVTETIVSNWTSNIQINSSQSVDFVLNPPETTKNFSVTAKALNGTGRWLSSMLTGIVLAEEGGDLSYSFVIPSSYVMQTFFSAMNSSTTGFQDLMDNLANSLSHYMRTTPYQPDPISGNSYSAVSHVNVRWRWIALPLILLYSSLALLLAVVIETSIIDLPPWGNNILATLFHGLDERPCQRELFDSQREMNNASRKLFVQYRDDIDGGCLVTEKRDKLNLDEDDSGNFTLA